MYEAGREADQLAVVILAESRERPDFVERAGVKQAVDPLTNGQSAQTMLALNSFGGAATLGQSGASAQFFNFGFPDHRVLPRRRSERRQSRAASVGGRSAKRRSLGRSACSGMVGDWLGSFGWLRLLGQGQSAAPPGTAREQGRPVACEI